MLVTYITSAVRVSKTKERKRRTKDGAHERVSLNKQSTMVTRRRSKDINDREGK